MWLMLLISLVRPDVIGVTDFIDVPDAVDTDGVQVGAAAGSLCYLLPGWR
jgi:hypothetical protein